MQDYALPALKRWWRLRVRGNVWTQESMDDLWEGRPFVLSEK